MAGLSNGAAVNVAGQVRVFMIMVLDPATCAQRPDLPWVQNQPNEQTTFDSSAQGHYDVYASANGFQLTLITPNHITLCSGQSVTQDGYLLPTGAVPEFPSTLGTVVVIVFALVAVSLFTKRSRRAFAHIDR